MFDNIIKFFKKFSKEDKKDSKDTAKERLHLVLMQDRANVSADFMELMKQEIIEVIKKYIDVDENSIDVKLTNKVNSDGTTGAPILYANIPILNVKDDTKQINIERKLEKNETVKEETAEENIEVQEEKQVENEQIVEEIGNEQEASKQEASEQEASKQEVSEQETSEQEASEQEASKQEASEQETVEENEEKTEKLEQTEAKG